ncbi:hypothetical protein H4219_001815 [Mycoemilia scoparia]|uniref:Bax inhibitor 1 n=1 Tax=Mycoemilia scoparia TaxID=417184 RepID=A0A9W8A4X4_9FUNG|nr:hypothetical protein H4219_001815 [Mycoemilia scoparia]
MDWNTLFNNSRISAKGRQQLVRVYQTLGLTVATASAGAYQHLAQVVPSIGGGYMSIAAAIVTLVALLAMEARPSNLNTRIGLLAGHGFFQGLSIGPFLDQLMLASSSGSNILFTALAATAVMFVSFSLSASATDRRTVMYLLALITAIASTFAWINISSLIFPISPYIGTSLLLGVGITSLYVIADTQLLLHTAETAPGGLDQVDGALVLFSDLFQLFVRLAMLLLEQEQRRGERGRRSDRKGKRVEREF